jgi:hypothetical protein
MTRKPFPKVGKVFELTMSKNITRRSLLEDFLWENSRGSQLGWSCVDGHFVAGTTCRCKLLDVGYRCNTDEVIRAGRAQGGKVLSGCWLEAFYDTFGHNGHNPVGVPDASWKGLLSGAFFPIRDEDGHPDFRFAGVLPSDNCLWLFGV